MSFDVNHGRKWSPIHSPPLGPLLTGLLSGGFVGQEERGLYLPAQRALILDTFAELFKVGSQKGPPAWVPWSQ